MRAWGAVYRRPGLTSTGALWGTGRCVLAPLTPPQALGCVHCRWSWAIGNSNPGLQHPQPPQQQRAGSRGSAAGNSGAEDTGFVAAQPHRRGTCIAAGQVRRKRNGLLLFARVSYQLQQQVHCVIVLVGESSASGLPSRGAKGALGSRRTAPAPAGSASHGCGVTRAQRAGRWPIYDQCVRPPVQGADSLFSFVLLGLCGLVFL